MRKWTFIFCLLIPVLVLGSQPIAPLAVVLPPATNRVLKVGWTASAAWITNVLSVTTNTTTATGIIIHEVRMGIYITRQPAVTNYAVLWGTTTNSTNRINAGTNTIATITNPPPGTLYFRAFAEATNGASDIIGPVKWPAVATNILRVGFALEESTNLIAWRDAGVAANLVSLTNTAGAGARKFYRVRATESFTDYTAKMAVLGGAFTFMNY